MAAAGNRPVIVVNPCLGNSAALSGFERAYLLRPLAVLSPRHPQAPPTPLKLHCEMPARGSHHAVSAHASHERSRLWASLICSPGGG